MKLKPLLSGLDRFVCTKILRLPDVERATEVTRAFEETTVTQVNNINNMVRDLRGESEWDGVTDRRNGNN